MTERIYTNQKEQIPRTALITGSAKRIGKVIALTLAKEGFDIAVHCNNSTVEAEKTAAEIIALGQNAIVVQADLSKRTDIEHIVPEVIEKFGSLGVLVNSASVFENDNISNLNWDSWEKHITPNLTAPLFMMQDLARFLPDHLNANIINILDQRVLNLTPEFMSYTVAKTGLWTLTRAVAMGLAPQIRVNGISPGPTEKAAQQSQQHFDARCKSSPLEHKVEPEEIAEAVKMIIKSPSMTGSLITIDSGMSLGWRQETK